MDLRMDARLDTSGPQLSSVASPLQTANEDAQKSVTKKSPKKAAAAKIDELQFSSWHQWATSKDCEQLHGCRYMSVLLNNSVGHLPGFIVPGVQKGGTTYLRHALMQHPNLQSARGTSRLTHKGSDVLIMKGPEIGKPGGEPHFFDHSWTKSGSRADHAQLYSDRHFDESLEEYRRAAPRQMFDVTPSYTTHEKPIARIKELLPWVRIVLVLREPTDRYRSELEMHMGSLCEIQAKWLCGLANCQIAKMGSNNQYNVASMRTS